MGLPAWFLPYVLGLLAVIALLATLRIHPSLVAAAALRELSF
jgi:hypothetical protein